MDVRRPHSFAGTLAVAAALACAPLSEASAQISFGQTFQVSGPDIFLESVMTGALEGYTSGVAYQFALFAFAGGELTGPALFTQDLTGPVARDQTVLIGQVLDPLQQYAFLLRTDLGGLSASHASDHMEGAFALCFGTECNAPAGDNDIDRFSANFSSVSVPEPGTALLLLTGLLGLGLGQRRRREALAA